MTESEMVKNRGISGAKYPQHVLHTGSRKMRKQCQTHSKWGNGVINAWTQLRESGRGESELKKGRPNLRKCEST